MKRILCLIDSLGAGGAQRQLVGLAVFLKERGYDVTVACYHDNRFYVNELLSSGVSYLYLSKAEGHAFRIWHIIRCVRNVKPDVVISYLETPSICACVAKIFNHKIKLIVSERNTTQYTGWNERIRFTLFRLADFVVPNAYSQEDYIRNSFSKLSDKVVTISNFVDLDYFVPPRNRLRRRVPEVLVAASIWESKNTLGFIDAIAKLKDKGYGFHVSWYGKSASHLDYYEQCRLKIKQLNVNEFIELKEKTASIIDKYQEADYFCLPSFYEGTPNVICEAMACGLPVVCSDVCDNSRYVEEKFNGFLFNPKDAGSIEKAIERLLSLSELEYQVYCRNSRKRAEETFSKETFVQSYVDLIER